LELGAASMFQDIIEGQHVRATFVGHEAFAVAISGADRIDWRGIPDVTYTPTDVPPSLRTSVLRYMDGFGLEYGAFDFVIDASGSWVFLECNPLGMYGFVEIATGLPITKAIVDRLCEPVRSPVRHVRTMKG